MLLNRAVEVGSACTGVVGSTACLQFDSASVVLPTFRDG
jgi:hypothetical protein